MIESNIVMHEPITLQKNRTPLLRSIQEKEMIKLNSEERRAISRFTAELYGSNRLPGTSR